MNDIAQRFAGLPGPHPAERLRLRTGSLGDYARLAEHHYRARKPATATRVLVYETDDLGPAARWLGDAARTDVVAVLVESLPSLSCRMRDYALHGRYGHHLAPGPRGRLLNEEVRCISRVVVEPRWRGLGLAVRLVKAALAEPTTCYTEALAAMGRVNPFFERAGMTAYPRPPLASDARLIGALEHIGLNPPQLTRETLVRQHLAALTEPRRRWFLRELKRWFRLNAGRSALHDPDPMHQLAAARDRLLLEPTYYLHDRRHPQTAA